MSIAGYRTIGAMDSLASNVLSRVAEGPVFHEFILEEM